MNHHVADGGCLLDQMPTMHDLITKCVPYAAYACSFQSIFSQVDRKEKTRMAFKSLKIFTFCRMSNDSEKSNIASPERSDILHSSVSTIICQTEEFNISPNVSNGFPWTALT